VIRPSDPERQRLGRTFEALCRIESPTGNERACADWIIEQMEGFGVAVQEDRAGEAVGSNAGNLLALIPGSSGRSILMCVHMDTVPLTAPVIPVIRDDGWENEGDGILGADNKAAVAALIELARGVSSAPDPPQMGLEMLFTVAEETGLNGASEFDVSRLHSDFGFVFDHASPIGEIISASPTHMLITAEIRGRAAHAGLEPELGINAIVAASRAISRLPQGRLDPETTANVGVITGGSATNVVADRCRIEAEVRSISQARLDEVVTTTIDTLQDAADSASCDLDVSLQKMFSGYRLSPSERSVALAQTALRDLGYEPRFVVSGGGADANALRSQGFECTNLANGTERAHQRDERVSTAALEDNLALMVVLLERAAEMLAGDGEGFSAR